MPTLARGVHAIVRLDEGGEAADDELQAFAAERLVSYKLPRTIEFTCEPLRDEAGKVRRGQLRQERIAALAGGRFFDRFRVAG